MRPIKPKQHKPQTLKARPKAEAEPGDCVFVQAITVTRAGAFMDCGLERDLLVPVSQQLVPMTEGHFYVVYLYLDPDNQLIGSTKLHKFLDERAKDMAAGEAVDLLIVSESDMGFKAVVNGSHLGLLYKGEIFRTLRPGDKTTGFIKSIREDRKIDLCLQRQTKQAKMDLTEKIIAFLESGDGTSTLTDYSPPNAIYKQYGVSKGNYKKALSQLYKQRKITITKDKITLL